MIGPAIIGIGLLVTAFEEIVAFVKREKPASAPAPKAGDPPAPAVESGVKETPAS